MTYLSAGTSEGEARRSLTDYFGELTRSESMSNTSPRPYAQTYYMLITGRIYSNGLWTISRVDAFESPRTRDKVASHSYSGDTKFCFDYKLDEDPEYIKARLLGRTVSLRTLWDKAAGRHIAQLAAELSSTSKEQS